MKKFKISFFYPVVIIIFLLLAIGLTKFKMSQMNLVTVSDDQRDYYLQTYSKTVEEVILTCGILLNPYDTISHDLNTSIKNNMTIQINRSFSLVIYDGNGKREVNTTQHRVRDILKEQNIEIQPLDIVAPFIDAKISEGTHISITRVWDEFVSEEYLIPYSTEINLVPDLEDTDMTLVQMGTNGMAKANYRIRYENGEMVSRNFVDEVVMIEPVNEIKNKGTDDLFITSRGLPFRYSKVIIARATAYDLSYESCGKYPSDPAYGITYSGTKARPGVIAVDPSIIPLNTHVYVESMDGMADYGFAIAEDTGSAIKGNKVDLFIGNHAAAMRYGRRNVRIYILDDPVDKEHIKGYGY